METKKLKTLVILTPGFPENEADSAFIPPQQVFVKALKAACPELNIVILTFQYPYFSGEYDWNGIKVIAFGGLNKGRIFRLLTIPRVWLAFRKLNREHEISGLLSFWFGKCAYVADLFAKRYRLKHYSWILGQDAKAGNKYFNKIKPAPDSLIALSDFIVTEFHKNYGVTPAHLIPVGIDTTMFGTAPAQRDIDIIGAGNLIPLKQFHIFLEVISAVKLFSPAIQAVICGGGPETERLNAMVTSMGLENNVTLKGKIEHTEVLALMQRAKVFLHTSAYEGFGAVCLEALYAGAQVVSFVRPMKADIKKWHTAADKEEMVHLLKSILGDPQPDHRPVLPYPIHANAKKMAALFGLL